MKGSFGEPWELKADGAVHAEDGESFDALWTHTLCGSGGGKAFGLMHHALSEEDSARIVAAVNACDGIDPAKLATFLEASGKAIVWLKGLRDPSQTYMSEVVLTDWAGDFEAAYDALTGDATP